MNEQLYELDVNQHDGLMGAIDSVGIDLTDKQRGDIFDAVRRFLVPVERCEHGNIDPHMINPRTVGYAFFSGGHCPGAGLDDEG